MPGNPLRNVLSYLRRVAEPAGESDDAALVERFVTKRDEAAFDALVLRHGPLVLGACRRILNDANDVDDVFQATFVVLARKAGAIRQRASVGAWLYGVAGRIARRARAQAERRRLQESQAVPSPASDPEAERAWRELRPVLDEELSALPEKYRLPLVLCYLEGKTWDEAARALGWPRGSMARRLEKGCDLLRARLSKRGVALPAAGLSAVLAPAALSAAVPAALHEDAVRHAIGGVVLTASLTPLVEGELRHMALIKLKYAVGITLTLGILVTGAGLTLLRNPTAAAPAVPELKKEIIELPADPKAVVFSLDQTGGIPRPRKGTDPWVAVHADGKVVIRNVFAGTVTAEGKVKPEDLQDLLRFLIKDQGFFEVDLAKAPRHLPPPPDSGHLTVRLNAGGKVRELSIALDGPNAKDTAEHHRVRAIHDRALLVPRIVAAGGFDAVRKALEQANAALKKKAPVEKPFAVEDLITVTMREGSTDIQFLRYDPLAAGASARTFIRAIVQRPEKGDASVDLGGRLGE